MNIMVKAHVKNIRYMNISAPDIRIELDSMLRMSNL
jgi:hypothetical protein